MFKVNEKVKYINFETDYYLPEFLTDNSLQKERMKTGIIESITITSDGVSYRIRYGKDTWSWDNIKKENLLFNAEESHDEIIAKVRENVLKQIKEDVNTYNKEHKTEGYNSKTISDVDWRLNEEANALDMELEYKISKDHAEVRIVEHGNV